MQDVFTVHAGPIVSSWSIIPWGIAFVFGIVSLCWALSISADRDKYGYSDGTYLSPVIVLLVAAIFLGTGFGVGYWQQKGTATIHNHAFAAGDQYASSDRSLIGWRDGSDSGIFSDDAYYSGKPLFKVDKNTMSITPISNDGRVVEKVLNKAYLLRLKSGVSAENRTLKIKHDTFGVIATLRVSRTKSYTIIGNYDHSVTPIKASDKQSETVYVK